ncbi:hypothetical protein O1157_14925 [Streptomyces albogriseolus]
MDIDKGAAWKKFFQATFVWLVLGGILVAAADAVGVIIFLAVEAYLIWKLVTTLQIPPVFGLVLNTSGTSAKPSGPHGRRRSSS